jgi:Fis family transcriptional regulator, factor for inversion stimulation protein
MKAQLEEIVLEMRANGVAYSEGLREFQKAFIAIVLRELKGNQLKAARKLQIHRNTLGRVIRQLGVDVGKLRPPSNRRHPHQT